MGSTDDALVGTGTATYRSDVGPAGACLYNGVAMGELVTIVNVDNGRSVECWTGPNLDEDAPPDELVLTPAGFLLIADLTDAPIHVEIRDEMRSPATQAVAGRSFAGAHSLASRDALSVTHSRPAVRELLTRRGLAPRRDLGQNFVADPNTVRRIAHLAGVGPGDRVIEIGAGLGSLTLALAERGADVLAVEIDSGLVDALREVVADRPSVRVVHADAMTLDWDELLGPAAGWVLVANLPYNVATPLVADLLARCRRSSGCSCSCSGRSPSVSSPARAPRPTGPSA